MSEQCDCRCCRLAYAARNAHFTNAEHREAVDLRARLDSVERQYRGQYKAWQNAESRLAASTALAAEQAKEIERLKSRQQELLQTIRNLSSSVPYAEEATNAATLIAEVGTLKARVSERSRDLSTALVRAACAEDAAAGYKSQLTEAIHQRDDWRAKFEASDQEMTDTCAQRIELIAAMYAAEAERDEARGEIAELVTLVANIRTKRESALAEAENSAAEQIAAWLEAHADNDCLARPHELRTIAAAIRANAYKPEQGGSK